MKFYHILALLIICSFIIQCEIVTKSSPPVYTIETSVTPEGAGSVSLIPAGGEYEEGDTVIVRAKSGDTWQFSKWEGDTDQFQSAFTVRVDDDKNFTAVFEKKRYPLAVSVEGEGDVEERTIQARSFHDHGTIVELTAIPDTGWTFSHWGLDLSGSNNPETIEITEWTDVSAIFDPIEYSLEFSSQGQGHVEADPDKDTYIYGDQVSVEAIPDVGWGFERWEGDISGSDNPQDLTIESNTSVTAIFDELLPQIQLWSCSSSCSDESTPPEQVTLPYSSSTLKFISTTASSILHGRFFLRAISQTYTVTSVSAKDRAGVTEAEFSGLDSNQKVKPGEDVEFELVSGLTGGLQSSLRYRFNIDGKSFQVDVVLTTN